MISRARVKAATIPEAAALNLLNDLDDAIKRRSIVEIRAFARECELSGLDQEAARGREILVLLEGSKSKARTMVKATPSAPRPARQPTPAEPSHDELVQRFNESQMMYDPVRYPSTEARIAAYRERERNETERLNGIRRSEEELRRAQVERENARREWADAETAKLPWWRR